MRRIAVFAVALCALLGAGVAPVAHPAVTWGTYVASIGEGGRAASAAFRTAG